MQTKNGVIIAVLLGTITPVIAMELPMIDLEKQRILSRTAEQTGIDAADRFLNLLPTSSWNEEYCFDAIEVGYQAAAERLALEGNPPKRLPEIKKSISDSVLLKCPASKVKP